MNPSRYPMLESLDFDIDFELGASVPIEFYTSHSILPIGLTPSGSLKVAVADPSRFDALDALAAALDRPLFIITAPAELIRERLLERARRLRKSAQELIEQKPVPPDSLLSSLQELVIQDSSDPHVIQLVNSILSEAVERRASDIHFEPEKRGLRVRYRIDGMLQPAVDPPENLKDLIISRLKVMARMDITRRHEPQDGNLSFAVAGQSMDVRVSAAPTPFGERLVLRLLGKNREQTDLASLGMPAEMISQIDRILSQNQGFLIVAGPTGSGKTTTLYACLHRIDAKRRNTITIEDPIEYSIPGVSQIQTGGREKIGFADGLRSLLRQDPDIIMVGEIRDGDTASTALRAAMTGHLILTTIHTGDPAGAITRLIDLGAEPALIAETLTGVLDQRLIRLKCSHCSGASVVQSLETNLSVDCPKCRGTGFFGRIGLFRLFSIDDEIRNLILKRDQQKIRAISEDQYRSVFSAQARWLVESGRTDRGEILRVFEKEVPI